MAETSKSGKKVARVESAAPSPSKGGKAPSEPTWAPTPEAKGRATRLRFIAIVLWLLAIAGEAATIFWVLKQDPINMVLLIVAIVVIGALALIGSLLWKKANRADPASRAQPFRFWVQNQLGVIISIIAFLPLILMIFLNKDLDKKQKGIAGTIAIIIALIAAYFSADFNSPSTEQYAAETQRIHDLTGQDLVYWTTDGKVYHLCSDASAVNLDSEDDTIHSGTVGDAHANGKDGITLEVETELNQCGYPVPENIDEIEQTIRDERAANN